MNNNGDLPMAEGLSRREFIRTLGWMGAVGTAAFGGWGALEWMMPDGAADEWHKSVCRFCGTGCGVMVGMRDGRITQIRGDEQAHNKGVICVKGSLLSELPNLKGRALHPKIKSGGTWHRASWEEALTLAANQFREAISEQGPDSVAFYGSGQLYTEESYTANKLFKAGIGTNNVDGNPRLCMASAAVGYIQTFGKDEPPGCYEDLDHADCFFIIGANPFECHPPLFERIRRRKALHPNTVLICVDPRRTETAKHCDYHLPVKPGTDMLLLNAMAQVIFENGLHDEKFINEHVAFSDGRNPADLQAFKNFLQEYTPEKVETRLGIPASQIRQTAHLFAGAKASTSLWTMGINQRTQGVYLNNMLSSLHLITGQIGRPGATPLSLTGQGNACGGVRDTGSLAHLLPGGRLVAKAEHRKEMEELWGLPEGRINPKPGHDAISLFRAMEEGKVRAALIMSSNPAQSMPALGRYRKAMEKCFLVVSDAFEDTETALLADILLPAALWVEKEGVFGQTERRYQHIPKLLNPPADAKSDLDILVALAEKLGHGEIIKAKTPKDVWDEWRKLSAHSLYNFEGITYERLKSERGIQWPCPSETHPGTKRRYVGGDDPFVGKGKRLEFYGHKDKRAVVFLRPYVESPEQCDAEFPMYLITGRVLEQWHTGTMTDRIPELFKASGRGCFEIHPLDARRLRVSNGQIVRVKSRFGSMEGRAKLSESPQPGSMFASFFDCKFLINELVADHVDPVSKEPEYKLTAVSLEPISQGRNADR